MSKPTRLQQRTASARKASSNPPTGQRGTKPVAPPVYRPQPTPKVLQKRSALPTPPSASKGSGVAAHGKMSPGVPDRVPPKMPAVYRPQPVPKVLQRKTAVATARPSVQPHHAPAAPKVYRPNPAPKVL